MKQLKLNSYFYNFYNQLYVTKLTYKEAQDLELTFNLLVADLTEQLIINHDLSVADTINQLTDELITLTQTTDFYDQIVCFNVIKYLNEKYTMLYLRDKLQNFTNQQHNKKSNRLH